VENGQVNDYVRGAALEAFLVLNRTRQVSREMVLEYFRSLFNGKLARTPSFIWGSLVCVVADLPAPELLEDVRQAYEDDLVDTMFADLRGIERDLKPAAAAKPWRQERQRLITDAIAEMEWWAAFHAEPSRPKKRAKLEMPVPSSSPLPSPRAPASPAPKPATREAKTGRNEPCPCGSGKKYKRGCGK
jgi:hypothetical protein